MFDFGFNLNPSVEEIKLANKRKQLPIRLANCEKRIKMLSQSKVYNRQMLFMIRTELDLRTDLKQQIACLN